MTSSVGGYESLGLGTAVQSSKKSEIGQADFLKLMTTQLQAQDPFKPMDSSQFLGQIAQFSQVSGLQDLNSAFAGLASSLTANQTLQGAALVGREVLVAGSRLNLGSEGSVSGAIEVPQSGWLSVEISDASGQVVRHGHGRQIGEADHQRAPTAMPAQMHKATRAMPRPTQSATLTMPSRILSNGVRSTSQALSGSGLRRRSRQYLPWLQSWLQQGRLDFMRQPSSPHACAARAALPSC